MIAIPLISKSTRPKYYNKNAKNLNQGIKNVLKFGTNLNLDSENIIESGSQLPDLHSIDILQIALDFHVKSDEIIEFLNILRNEAKAQNVVDAYE